MLTVSNFTAQFAKAELWKTFVPVRYSIVYTCVHVKLHFILFEFNIWLSLSIFILQVGGNPVPHLEEYITVKTEIDFPAKYLDYGLYKFELNISMDGELGIYTVDSVTINIVKSPLVVDITGYYDFHQ